MNVCSVDGCKDIHYGKGYCRRHYSQMKTNGKITKIDRGPILKLCGVEGCEDKHYGNGYCQRHYHQIAKYGKITKIDKDPSLKLCIVDGCGKKHSGLGYCDTHRQQFKKYGKILSEEHIKNIHFNKFNEYDDYVGIILNDKDGNFKAEGLIDKDRKIDVEKHKWHQSVHGYPATSINGKSVSLHTILYPNTMIDHINGNKLDNRSCNLRSCTRSQNSHNRKTHINNTSGISGVYWHTVAKKWRACITVNYKMILLGLFDNFEDAKDARLKAEKQYYGEFAPNR